MLNSCLNPVVPVRVVLLKVKHLILSIKRHFKDIFTIVVKPRCLFFFPPVAEG